MQIKTSRLDRLILRFADVLPLRGGFSVDKEARLHKLQTFCFIFRDEIL
jgi:hypothetical protein